MEEPTLDIQFFDDDGKFKLPKSVIGRMRQFAQVGRTQSEAGGLLLGRLMLESNDVIIDEITTPQSTDIRSRFRFRREPQGHQQILDDRWHRSEGTCNYVGEWHTHPEPNPSPSNLDIRSWRKQVGTLPTGRQELFFVIVGTESIAVWKANRFPFSYHQLRATE